MTNSVHVPPQATTRGEAPSNEETRSAQEPIDRSDAVELSAAAREQLERDESAPIRAKLVERVRAEIAAGTYLTDEKLEAAVKQMYADVLATA